MLKKGRFTVKIEEPIHAGAGLLDILWLRTQNEDCVVLLSCLRVGSG